MIINLSDRLQPCSDHGWRLSGQKMRVSIGRATLGLALIFVSLVAHAQRDTSITARFIERPPFPPGSGVIIEATITNLGTIPLVFEQVGFEAPTAQQFYADFEFIGSNCEPVVACSYRYCRNAASPSDFLPGRSNICNWTFRVKPDALNQSSAVRLKVGTSDPTPGNNFADLVAIVGPKPPPEPINALSFPALFSLLLAVAVIGGFKLLRR